jgi:hypothetical protein
LQCEATERLNYLQDDVPTNFPTDTIIHRAAMALVEKGRAGVHQDIIAGLLETWVPWMRQELELITSVASTQQVTPGTGIRKIVFDLCTRT